MRQLLNSSYVGIDRLDENKGVWGIDKIYFRRFYEVYKDIPAYYPLPPEPLENKWSLEFLEDGGTVSGSIALARPQDTTLVNNRYCQEQFGGAYNMAWMGATNTWSVSVWFKIKSGHTPSNEYFLKNQLVEMYSGATIGRWFLIRLTSLTEIRFQSGGFNNSDLVTVDFSTSLSDDTWYNLVITCDGSAPLLTGYLNGSVLGTNSSSYLSRPISQQLSALSFTFGENTGTNSWNPAGNSGSFKGLVNDLAVFDVALSASQVTTLYNDGKPISLDFLSPKNWWRMGDGVSQRWLPMNDPPAAIMAPLPDFGSEGAFPETRGQTITDGMISPVNIILASFYNGNAWKKPGYQMRNSFRYVNDVPT